MRYEAGRPGKLCMIVILSDSEGSGGPGEHGS